MKKGWQIKKIGEVCNLMTGGTPSKSKPEYFKGGTIKWLVSGDVHKKIINDCNGRITEEGLKNSNAKYLPFNSVIIALNGQGKTRGSVALLKTKATCNQSLVSISPKNSADLLSEYIYLFLDSKYDELRKITGDQGNDRRGLNMPLIRNIEIPIPPILEQQRIVKILDEVFEKTGKAQENCEKNLENVKKLLNTFLQVIFTKDSNNWKDTTIGDICDLISGQHINSKDYNTDLKGIGYLTGPSDFTALNPIVTKWTEHPKVKARKGDILITVKGSGVGKINLLNLDEVAISRQLMAIRPLKVETKFIYAFLSLQYNMFQSLGNGAAIPGISRQNVLNLKCPIPPVDQQKEIGRKIEMFTSEIKKITLIYEQKLVNLEKLKKSLLQQLFTGKL